MHITCGLLQLHYNNILKTKQMTPKKNVPQLVPAGQFLSYYASESAFQTNCKNAFEATYPHLKHKLYHPPNGGKRTKKAGAKLKAEGTKAGVPDLMLFESIEFRNHKEMTTIYYAGLAIELKSKIGKLSVAQSQWLFTLKECGWQTHVLRDNGHGTDEFMKIVDNYLSLK